MNNITIIVEKIYTLAGFILPVVLLAVLFQMPTLFPDSSNTQSMLSHSLAPASVMAGEIVTDRHALPMAETFFGREVALKKTKDTIEKQVAFVSSRKAYAASLAVIQKHERTIKRKAAENKVPSDVAIGVGLLENGGSETAKSSAGALGVFQLMPGTARSLGLTVNKSIDERRNPEKNIDAGMRYLRSNFDRFGDWGLATWAYHAGEGNVSKAIKIYAKANHGIALGGVKKPSEMKTYVEKHSITIHKLLSDPSVKQFTRKLNDDSSGYPYKVVATAELFKEASQAQEVVSR